MIYNIIDRRNRKYRWKAVTAIIEPTCHDNSCKDSDQMEPGYEGIGYNELAETSIAGAVLWAQSISTPVTLYLYDLGRGINIERVGLRGQNDGP